MGLSEEIAAHCSAGTLPELISDYYFKRGEERSLEELEATAISLHNNGAIDLLAPALSLTRGQGEGYNFFAVQSFYLKVMPSLESDVPPMMAAVRSMIAASGTDILAAGPSEGYLRNHLPAEYADLPVKICLCFGGDVSQSVREEVIDLNEQRHRRSWQVMLGAGH